MSRRLISTGSPFEKHAGYSRAVVQETSEGIWCFVSGTTGYDYITMTMPGDLSAQVANIFRTIAAALDDAGLSLADIVRANYIITDASFRDEAFTEIGKVLTDIRPAATMIIAGLVDPEMKIEIDVTAFRTRNA